MISCPVSLKMGRLSPPFVFSNKIEVLFAPELCRHLRHMPAVFLRIVIRAGTDGAETVRRQASALQPVSPELAAGFIRFAHNLLYGSLR